MVGNNTFIRLSDSAGIRLTNCSLQLNVLWRQLELHFDLLLPGDKFDRYKIILPLKFITPDSFIVKRFQPTPAQHSIIFEMSVAPQVWKKSEMVDEEDLKDRLYWNENEQWIRQCEIVEDPSNPVLNTMDTRIIMNHLMFPTGFLEEDFKTDVIGRWKTYYITLGAGTAEDESQMSELLSILHGFNIKVTEKPITMTKSIGEALGPEIESQLEGLPYNVRYSFDVCLAHSYLYIPGFFFAYLETNTPFRKSLSIGSKCFHLQQLAAF
jgi:hypothetical protein